ncbi:hypothetical protein [Bradyrhizobium sp. Ec3.3]|uniref:hypothetical protein n=1 Tax=Bradyrhizobium sp. Ec3.3 TaxID=189753 RepID=UPI0003FBB3F6|nr:hypothetical protein [Bradyrhizobium sp. Ec3.3]
MADDPLSKVALVARERIFKNREIIKPTIANVAAGNPRGECRGPRRVEYEPAARVRLHGL